MTTKSSSAVKSPRVAIILVSLVAVLQVIRIAALFMIKDVLAGITPDAWLFPAMMDVFVGAAALFIAFGLWKGKGLAVWTSAIVFFCLSISDHFDAMTVALNTKGPLPTMMSGPVSGTVIQLTVMSLIEVAVIWALASKSLRNHYLTAETAK